MNIVEGTEQSAQLLFLDILEQYGFTRQQAFPDNYTKGTNRITGTTTRDTSIMVNLFNPTLRTYTWVEKGLPLLTRTKGEIGNLVIWAGMIGLREVMKRKPTSNILKTKVLRDYFKSKNMSFSEGLNQLEQKANTNAPANKPQWTRNPQSPNEPWPVGLPIGADEQTKEQFLTSHFPDYIRWVLQLPEFEEARKELDAIGYSDSDKIKLFNRVDAATPKNMADVVFNHAINADNTKWHIVVIANRKLHPLAEKKGFMHLDDDTYLNMITHPKVPAAIKEALEMTQSPEGRLKGMNSRYYIKPPMKLEFKKAWQMVLKAYQGGHAGIPLGPGGGKPPKKPTKGGKDKPSDCPEGEFWNPKTQKCEKIPNLKSPIDPRVASTGVPRTSGAKESPTGTQEEVNPNSDVVEKQMKSWIKKWMMNMTSRYRQDAYSESEIDNSLNKLSLQDINEMFSQENQPTESNPLEIMGVSMPKATWDGLHQLYQTVLGQYRVGFEFPESPFREDLHGDAGGARHGNLVWSELTTNEQIYAQFLEWYEWMEGNIDEDELDTIDNVVDRFVTAIENDTEGEGIVPTHQKQIEEQKRRLGERVINDETLIGIIEEKAKRLKEESN